MSYTDPPRRPRLSRYPALAPQEDGHPSYTDTRADFGTDFRTATDRAPWDTAPHDRAPWDTAPRDRAPRDTAPRDRAPRDTAPRDRAPRDTAPRDKAPWDTAPRDKAPWDTAPRDRAPWETAPRRSTGGLRAVPDIPRQTGGMRPLGDREQPEGRGGGPGRGSRGLLAGAAAGFLAAATAIGMGNLAAAFVRPQASPIIAVGETFINHTPSTLKNFAVQKFGENDKTMLLLGMYLTIALLAIFIGMLAWRRIALGAAGIGLFGLFGAYTAITLPASHVTDVIPSIISGIAGVAVLVWLVRIGTSQPRHRAARAGRRS